MSAGARISAVVCTYDRYDLLEVALASLRTQTIGADEYSIIVVDNSPDAGRAQVYTDKYNNVENIKYLYTPIAGLSNARNLAARECRTEFVAYLDDDAEASSAWLEHLIGAFDAFGPSSGAVGGPILPIWQDARPAWLPDELLGALTAVDWGGGLRIADEREWIAGANMAFRSEALLAAGAFSTSLGRVGAGGALLSNEEVEVVAKLRAGGLQVVWAPGAKVRHLVARERLNQGWLRKRYAWQAVSDFLKGDRADLPSSEVCWRGLTEYFNGLPPRLRTPRGLFVERTDPDEFAKQALANYTMTMLLLLGHEIVDAGRPLEPSADNGRR
jgi:glycosyltransferase involved in cell wall biosynthesis